MEFFILGVQDVVDQGPQVGELDFVWLIGQPVDSWSVRGPSAFVATPRRSSAICTSNFRLSIAIAFSRISTRLKVFEQK